MLSKGLISLKFLKEEVFALWDTEFSAVAAQPEQFKPDVRKRFGDLRKRATWENAYAYYYSEMVSGAIGYEAEGLYQIHFAVSTWPAWQKSLRLKILDALIANPRCLELLRNSLEAMINFRGISYAEAVADEFLSLVYESNRANDGSAHSSLDQFRYHLPATA